jgi:RNA-directed DNA polymerase
MKRALEQVRRNKGAPGIDGMTVDNLVSHLKEHWPAIRAQLLNGTYQPQPVRRVEIPKATGGKRALGIPCVLVNRHPIGTPDLHPKGTPLSDGSGR